MKLLFTVTTISTSDRVFGILPAPNFVLANQFKNLLSVTFPRLVQNICFNIGRNELRSENYSSSKQRITAMMTEAEPMI